MWVSWVIAIAILVVGIVVLSHLGVDVLGVMSNGFHAVEHFLGTSL